MILVRFGNLVRRIKKTETLTDKHSESEAGETTESILNRQILGSRRFAMKK